MGAAFECLTGSNRPAIGGSGSGEADVKTLEASPACQHSSIIALRPPSSRVTLLGKRRLNERGGSQRLGVESGLAGGLGQLRRENRLGVRNHAPLLCN